MRSFGDELFPGHKETMGDTTACNVELTETTSNVEACILSQQMRTIVDNDQPDSATLAETRDFTLIYAPNAVTSCDESTEILSVDSECTGRRSSHVFSGTDSDVEVLMSEEINAPEWVPHYSKTENCICITNGEKKYADKVHNHPQPTLFDHPESSTDHDVSSVDEFSEGSYSSYEHLSRRDLIAMVEKQTEFIKSMEKILQRYQATHTKLFDQIDQLRKEYMEIESTVNK